MPLKYQNPVRILNKASSAEKNLQAQQADFYKTLTQSYATQFAGQSAILKSLNNAFQPILSAGIGQFGFTPAEEASMRTSASDTIAQQQQNAQVALNENLAARGGGNAAIPSGATAQLEAGLLGDAAKMQSAAQNAITQAGYATGRSNFLAASGALAQNASLLNPTGYISGANSAGADAFSSANVINQQNTAWQSALGGLIGGAAGAFLGPVGSMAGAKFGSGAFGGGSGGGDFYSGAGASPVIPNPVLFDTSAAPALPA